MLLGIVVVLCAPACSSDEGEQEEAQDEQAYPGKHQLRVECYARFGKPWTSRWLEERQLFEPLPQVDPNMVDRVKDVTSTLSGWLGGKPREEEPELSPEQIEELRREQMEAALKIAKMSAAQINELGTIAKRDRLCISTDTFRALRYDADVLRDDTQAYITRFREMSLAEKFGETLPLQILLIVLFAFYFLDRRAKQLRRELWDMAPPLSTPLLDNLLDSSMRVLARILPVAVVLLFAVFLRHGFYRDEKWMELLIELFGLQLVYRAMHSAGNELLVGEIFPMSRKPVNLRRWYVRMLQVVFGLLSTMEIIRVYHYRPDVYALLALSLKVFIALYSFRLFALKDELTQLLPDVLDNPFYRWLRRTLNTQMRVIVAVSSGLLLLWAIGLSNAARLLMVRLYSFFGVLILSVWFYRRVQLWLQKLIRRYESEDGEPTDRERHNVLEALERSFFMVGGVLVVVLQLNALGVWEVIRDTASYDFFPNKYITLSIYHLGRAFFVFSVFSLASRAVRALFNEKVFPRFDLEVGVSYAINTMVHYFLFVLGFLLSLVSLGLDLSALVVFGGALGIGIGFGLQDIVSNLLSGFILLFGRSVRKGDFVTVSDTYGRIDAVGSRSVTIRTPDNYELVIPSSVFVSSSIINWTLTTPYVRLGLTVGVSYDADLHHVKEAMLAAARRHSKLLQRPRPEVWLEEFADSSINMTLFFYIDCRQTTQRRVKGELNLFIWEEFKKESIEIPFPQRDLHIRTSIPVPIEPTRVDDDSAPALISRTKIG